MSILKVLGTSTEAPLSTSQEVCLNKKTRVMVKSISILLIIMLPIESKTHLQKINKKRKIDRISKTQVEKRKVSQKVDTSAAKSVILTETV